MSEFIYRPASCNVGLNTHFSVDLCQPLYLASPHIRGNVATIANVLLAHIIKQGAGTPLAHLFSFNLVSRKVEAGPSRLSVVY